MTGDARSNAIPALYELAQATAGHIDAQPQSDPELGDLARRLSGLCAAVPHQGPLPRRPTARAVRALCLAPAVFATPPAPGLGRLTNAAIGAFAYVNWTQFYAEDDWSRSFLPGFANGEGIGPDGIWQSDDLILGLFVLGPGLTYPSHAHPAAEFYIPISGAVEFSIGAGSPFRARSPGEVILHPENVPHAIRTDASPFFAVFGWAGALNAPSWYRDDMSDSSLPVKFPTIAKD